MCQTKMVTTSVCIPRINSTMSRNYIENTFDRMKVGHIEKMYEIPLHKDPSHNRVIIKMNWDTRNDKTKEILSHMKSFGSVNLVYDMPWYWKMCPAR